MAEPERPGTEEKIKAPLELKPDFGQVVQAFALQALLACGKIMNPLSRKYEKDPTMARYHIGVLEVLQEKTKGNLSTDEIRLLEDVLHQARMAFIDAGAAASASERPVESKVPGETPRAD